MNGFLSDLYRQKWSQFGWKLHSVRLLFDLIAFGITTALAFGLKQDALHPTPDPGPNPNLNPNLNPHPSPSPDPNPNQAAAKRKEAKALAEKAEKAAKVT